MQRRIFIRAIGGAAAASLARARAGSSTAGLPTPAHPHPVEFEDAVRRIEVESGGRLGVGVLDAATGIALTHRGGERFPTCSTFKLLAAAHVLARVDQGLEQLSRGVPVRAEDLVDYSPVTQPRVGGKPMSMAELCEAAVTLSDNTAGNLLLQSFGGPVGLSAFVRTLGDESTRFDRTEPSLNEATPADPRDTTTPAAMLQTLRKILLGDALAPTSREQMTRWLLDNKTGAKKLRAGLPADWRVGDKTGAGARGTDNDIGVLFPPGRPPLLVCAFLTETSADLAVRDGALAAVGRWVASRVANES